MAIVGSAPPLGSWDASKALLLATDRDKYPVWEGQAFLACTGVGADEPIEYKYIKLTTDEDSTAVEWEPLGQNRLLDCQQKASLVVSELYGVPERQNETFVLHHPTALPD